MDKELEEFQRFVRNLRNDGFAEKFIDALEKRYTQKRIWDCTNIKKN